MYAKRMRIALLSVVLALTTFAGCSHSSGTRVMGPDGMHDWVLVRCRGEEHCFEKAEEMCPGGYDIAEKGEGKDYVVMHSDAMTTVHAVEHGRMLIKCHH